MDCQPLEPVARAGYSEPALATSFRRRPGQHAKRFWQKRSAAEPSGIIGLAGRGVGLANLKLRSQAPWGPDFGLWTLDFGLSPALEPKAHSPAHRDIRSLPASQRLTAGGNGCGRRVAPALAISAAAVGSRAAPRCHPCRQRQTRFAPGRSGL